MDPRSILLLAPLSGYFGVTATQSGHSIESVGSFQDVYWDTLDENGRLTGGKIQRWVRAREGLPTIPAPITTLTQSLLPANSANRLDLVVVGDGYQTQQLGTYATQVASIATALFNKDPYLTYAPLFLVHRVDVVSIDSGVDNDPTPGVLRNTAMDMGFYCNGIDRLLCVDESLALQYAQNAPDVDLVLAIANSATYGGAGYPQLDLATAAAGNAAALEIARHEFGHALGNLADEYTTGGPTTYSGPEPAAGNVSKLDAAAMAAAMTKWFRWLGVNNPAFDGVVSTFEGAHYSQLGIYRPTNDSLMRSLGRPFNLPSAEKIVLEIYRIVRPIDDASPTSTVYAGTETLFVTPVAPVGNPLTVQWKRDGVPIPGATGTSLDLSLLDLGRCPLTISVTVRDGTAMVRDEAARDQWMTESRTYTVQPGGTGFETVCVATPNSAGSGSRMDHGGSNGVGANDLVLYTFGCPAEKLGFYIFGSAQTQLTLGNGIRCVASPFQRFPPLVTNVLGDAEFAVDLSNLPGSQVVQPGSVRYFQLYFRDPQGGGAGTDLSDALRVKFCP